MPDRHMPQRLRDMCLVDPDRAVEDHRLTVVQPPQRGEVTDLRGGQFGVGVEVELREGGGASVTSGSLAEATVA
jgi:hypothetical protein